MKGDFSKWDVVSAQNLNGVLHQQGRVLLDGDWNAQTRISLDWQDQAAQQMIGGGVAAIPAQEPNAFRVAYAKVEGVAYEDEGGYSLAYARAQAVQSAIEDALLDFLKLPIVLDTSRFLPKLTRRFGPTLASVNQGKPPSQGPNQEQKVYVYIYHRKHSAGELSAAALSSFFSHAVQQAIKVR